ncbi:PREDICTED: transcription termination factor MTEF1, chloroplastic-like [Tarenaya hassleriana]|uniref:transcription termination factor MTEF1, chloroplastic-like n=1 Tax=Tarenaya hassleriana TaxID=28532 RepID=UPI00053C64CA|nr:PREDICTED: transcription termination factor MTEF1, chloroplastic-like [Tarenaya hassleriana]
MIHSLRRTKLIALVNILAYTPTQFTSVSSLERLRFLSTLVPAQDNSSKSSFSISSLIGSAPESDVDCLQSSNKPNLVLKFLKDNGFSESQIKSVVSRWPRILVSDPEKTLRPKMDFLFSKGISKPEFLRIVSEEPRVLNRSVEKHLIPLFDMLKDVTGSKKNAVRAVRNYPFVFRCSTKKSIELNMKKLHDAGVPKYRIAKLMILRLRGFARQPSRFEEAIAMVKAMGFQPREPTFGIAVGAIGWCSKSTWEGKMNQFRSYGLSDSEILVGFKKQPSIMMFKEKNTRAKMNFFLKGMHWSLNKVIVAPQILLLSLEKRIIPRLTVLHLLESQGEVKEGEISSVTWLLKLPEKKFVEEFVTRYEDRIPQVVDAHEGKLEMEDLHRLNSKAVFKRNEFWSGS